MANVETMEDFQGDNICTRLISKETKRTISKSSTNVVYTMRYQQQKFCCTGFEREENVCVKKGSSPSPISLGLGIGFALLTIVIVASIVVWRVYKQKKNIPFCFSTSTTTDGTKPAAQTAIKREEIQHHRPISAANKKTFVEIEQNSYCRPPSKDLVYNQQQTCDSQYQQPPIYDDVSPDEIFYENHHSAINAITPTPLPSKEVGCEGNLAVTTTTSQNRNSVYEISPDDEYTTAISNNQNETQPSFPIYEQMLYA